MTDELKNLEEKAQEYDASQIQVLEGLEAVSDASRDVYWIDTPNKACITWYGRLSITQLMRRLAGFASHIKVFIEPDNCITVVDDGRGIPVDIQEKTGRPAVETVFTVLTCWW